jgi:hypothetical protein
MYGNLIFSLERCKGNRLMPTSYPLFKEEISRYIRNRFANTASLLDVGPGCGTYGKLFQDFPVKDAVEIWEPYVDEYKLRDIYRQVYVDDIRTFQFKYYDIVIYGDVIEHLSFADAYKVLTYAYPRSQELIVAVPYNLAQGPHYGNTYETHLQADLTPAIMEQRYPMLRELFHNVVYGIYSKTEGWL